MSDKRPDQVSTLRRVLPQLLATCAKNLLVLDIGLSLSFITIVVPAVRGIADVQNETIFFDDAEVSWLVSLCFVGQPIGSLLSGWVTEPMGRKRSLILVNIPHILAWLLLGFATEKWHMYTAVTFIGLGVGLMEAPILTYVSEISEVQIRGILLSLAMSSAMFGYFIVYLLGAVTHWRVAARICVACPVSAMIAVSFVPETPIWLISQNREAEALLALQWLRGWVSQAAVADEHERMCQAHGDLVERSNLPPSSIVNITAFPIREQLRLLVRPATCQPFVLMLVLFANIQFGGFSSMRPYMIQIFATMLLPQEAKWITVVCATVGLAGSLLCTICIRWLGKRVLFIVSCCICIVCLLILADHAHRLTHGASSFDKPLPPFNTDPTVRDWLALGAVYVLVFFTTLGVYTVTFNLLAEVFPLQTRGVATGIACGVNYMMGFTSAKTFYLVEEGLTLTGIFLLFASVMIASTVYAWFNMPDTENLTLHEVEIMYDKSVSQPAFPV